MKTSYPKHYSSPTQIVQLLKNHRGMVIADEAKAERYFTNISYHRLSAYIFPFYQMPKSDLQLKGGTTFEKVMALYRFDKKLCIIKYMLNIISPNNDMRDKLNNLFSEYPQIDLSAMGFSTDWDKEQLWQ